MKLFKHQEDGIVFLTQMPAALLGDEMGLGKTRQALEAAGVLYHEKKITQMLVLCPAAVRYSWGEELGKMIVDGFDVSLCSYLPNEQRVSFQSRPLSPKLTVMIVSYGLLSWGWGPEGEIGPHVLALEKWAKAGRTILVCDESSFIRNAQAHTTMGALRIRQQSRYCWLLNGTPVANTPVDMFAQGLVMCDGGGPNAGIKNFYHFRNKYGMMGGYKMKQWIPDKTKLEELRRRWKPYVLRRTKFDCLDLPDKLYTTREIALSPKTWKIYKELREEALTYLPNEDMLVEPNAGVRLVRLRQITSGHVTQNVIPEFSDDLRHEVRTIDVSCEKLLWLEGEITEGELSNEHRLIVWCCWRRERERLGELLDKARIRTGHVFGSQTHKQREGILDSFIRPSEDKMVLLAQPHAGGFGLNLTQAATAVYLSNDYSYITRVQSEDRCHRMGQTKNVTYIDVLATGPENQRTIDHVILKALKAKEDLATWTCAMWRKVL